MGCMRIGQPYHGEDRSFLKWPRSRWCLYRPMITFHVATGSLGLPVRRRAPIHTRVCTMGTMPSHRMEKIDTRRNMRSATAAGMAVMAPLHLIEVESPMRMPEAITPFQVLSLIH